MAIGFSWISLDSLVRIENYQWLTRGFRENFFLRALPAEPPETGGAAVEIMQVRRIIHAANATSVSAFRQYTAVSQKIATRQFNHTIQTMPLHDPDNIAGSQTRA
jgi:hypothetical protein